MEKSNTRLHDENNGLDYVLVRRLLLSCLDFGRGFSPCWPLGQNAQTVSQRTSSSTVIRFFCCTGRLNTYLADTDTQAEEQLELLTQQMAEREGMNEELKAANTNGMGAQDEQYPEPSGGSY